VSLTKLRQKTRERRCDPCVNEFFTNERTKEREVNAEEERERERERERDPGENLPAAFLKW